MSPPARTGPPPGDSPEHKLAMLRGRLLTAAGAIQTTEDWERALRAAAQLPGESFANVLLIQAQHPGATLVKGYEEWRAVGRQVSRGQQGIEVFSRKPPSAPGRDGRRQAAGSPAPGWRDASRVARVWDVAQTTGPPVSTRTALSQLAGLAPPGMWDALCWLARREGFAVEREHGAPADGVTFWTAYRIRVLPGLAPGQAAWALAHQLGHVIIHGASRHEPGATTSGDACTGIRKAEADAVAFIACTRHRIATVGRLASPGSWAGSDPRAQPAAAILAAGERVTRAAERVTRHLEHSLPDASLAITIQPPARAAAPPGKPRQRPPAAAAAPHEARPDAGPAVPPGRLTSILTDAAAFYRARVPGTWVPEYLRSRGIGPGTARDWQFGYAPPGWTELTGHLRAAGYADEEIEAAGLARRYAHGTLIDHFRDRVMLPVHDQDGQIAGFTGRAKPGAGPATPKYLNSPETALYKKGGLLFGLHQARAALSAGATPVIVEGPFDAIAVTIAGTGQLAGLAPCGTALTTRQAELLAGTCALDRSGALVAFDDDPAGRKAAIRAYAILRPHTASLRSAALCGRDPAQILQDDGPQALRDMLTTAAVPVLSIIIDAELSRWEHRLGDVEGPLRAMRSAAAVLAGLLPADAAAKVTAAAGGTELATVDDDMCPVTPPQAPGIAQALPADTAFQVTRLADLLGFGITETVIGIANAVIRLHGSRGILKQPTAAWVAAESFPANPSVTPDKQTPAQRRRPAPPGRRRAPRHQPLCPHAKLWPCGYAASSDQKPRNARRHKHQHSLASLGMQR